MEQSIDELRALVSQKNDELPEKNEVQNVTPNVFKNEVTAINEIKQVKENGISSIIKNQYKENETELSKKEEFISATKQITERAVHAKLEEDAISILDKEQKNDLAKYILGLEKEKFNFRKKKEKKIIIEEIKADLQNKKIEALKKRYGYLYNENEVFIPSKIHNMQKEFVNRWVSTSDNTKKIIKALLKLGLIAGVAVISIWIGYKAVKWIIENSDKLAGL